jgi:pimeloyl-ACP methyl ester carboxylesterase
MSKVDNVHLIGHSLGGWAAAEMATRNFRRRPW